MQVDTEVRGTGHVWVAGIDAEDSHAVWEAAARAEVHIQQLSSAKNSLEEVFFKAVKEAEHAAA